MRLAWRKQARQNRSSGIKKPGLLAHRRVHGPEIKPVGSESEQPDDKDGRQYPFELFGHYEGKHAYPSLNLGLWLRKRTGF